MHTVTQRRQHHQAHVSQWPGFTWPWVCQGHDFDMAKQTKLEHVVEHYFFFTTLVFASLQSKVSGTKVSCASCDCHKSPQLSRSSTYKALHLQCLSHNVLNRNVICQILRIVQRWVLTHTVIINPCLGWTLLQLSHTSFTCETTNCQACIFHFGFYSQRERRASDMTQTRVHLVAASVPSFNHSLSEYCLVA